MKYRERIGKLEILEGRVDLRVREFLGCRVYGSAPNFNFCQTFDSIEIIKIL